MSYTIICEGEQNCTDYQKCVKQYEKTGVDKCIKKKAFKQYACNGDNCLSCTNLHNCELILPTIESLTQDQERINELKIQLNIIQEDLNYLQNNPTIELYNVNPTELKRLQDNLIEELRTLRLKENKKIKILRKRSLRKLEV